MTRIVHCPGCKVLLVEPADTPIYQCAQCSMVLYAKHAVQSSAQSIGQVASEQDQKDGPLYAKRDTSSHLGKTANVEQDASNRNSFQPLYSPRNPPHHDLLLLQDVRKLARDAFPSGGRRPSAQKQEEEEGGGVRRWEETGKEDDGFPKQQEVEIQSQNNRAVEQDDDFAFHKPTDHQGDMYDPAAADSESTSDYLSTLSEFEIRSQVSEPHTRQSSSGGREEEMKGKEAGDFHVLQQQPKQRLSPVRNGFTRSSLSDSSFRLETGAHDDNQQLSSAPSPTAAAATARRSYPRLAWPYVVCQHCKMLLEVPRKLPPCKNGVQKLKCGACQKISRFSADGSSGDQYRFEATRSAAEPASRMQASTSSIVDFSFSSTSSSSQKPESVSRGSSSSSRAVFPRSEDKKQFLPPTPASTKRTQASLDFSFGDSPSRGSAPPSFHHRTRPSSSNFSAASEAGKGYDSAPEILSNQDTVRPSSSHAKFKSDSTFPTAPCLHQLFGYESPTHFLTQVEQQKRKQLEQQQRSRGIRGFLARTIHGGGGQPMNRVSINGKTVPEDVVRRAERRAGPVHPGSYWYDYRAGFWGVMGGPCLGIIPPYIEEFNYPMPVHCAGGKTGIIVNGRELHHKDLEKLAQRGLPSTPGMSYSVSVDGTVIDLASEAELQGLGRLAPTIEDRNVGFGMFPLSRA